MTGEPPVHLSQSLAIEGPQRANGEETLLDVATAKMSEAALSRQPVFYDSVMRLFNRRRMVFRSVLLPLSSDRANVTHVFGAANGRGGLPDV